MLTLYFYDTSSGIRSIQINSKIFTIYTYGMHEGYESLISKKFAELNEAETIIGKKGKYYIKLGRTDYMIIYDGDLDHFAGHSVIQTEKYFTHLHIMRCDRKSIGEVDISTLKQLFLHPYLSKEQLTFFLNNLILCQGKDITVTFVEKKIEPAIYLYIIKRSTDPRLSYGLFSRDKYSKKVKLEAAQWVELHQSYLRSARAPTTYIETLNEGDIYDALQQTKNFYELKI